MQLVPFNTPALIFIGLYLMSLLGIGWLGLRARQEDSLRDFYVGGRGIGLFVLLLTLYATQYSGNTLFGFTGKTYRDGYSWATSLHFMTAIVAFYLLFAPKLYGLARTKGFITPTDYLHDRFGSREIDLLAPLVMIVAISNYLLAQLMAMGRALEGLSGNPVLAYVCGVIVLTIIIAIYETMGGFRAVAWTDVIQGLILMIGFAILLVMVFRQFGSLGFATDKLASNEETVGKIAPLSAEQTRTWFSYILTVGIGGALYPQAIQRIYAARTGRILRRSFIGMAFLPLTTTLVALIVGIIAAAHLPGYSGAGSDKILTVMCRQIQESSLFGYWLVVVLFAAVLAAIMSTADSVLLSISSMFTKDLYGRFVNPGASEARLTHLGKVLSWFVLVVVMILAIVLRNETSLVKLLDRKFDLLLQLAPAFFIGVHWKGLKARPTLIGMLVGLVIALTLGFGYGKVAGIHAGLFGLSANLLVAVIGSVASSKSAR